MYCFFNIVLIFIHYIYQKCFYNSEILWTKSTYNIFVCCNYYWIQNLLILQKIDCHWLTSFVHWLTYSVHCLYLTVHFIDFHCTPLHPIIQFYWTALYPTTDFHCIRLYAAVQSTDKHCTPLCATESFLRVKPSV